MPIFSVLYFFFILSNFGFPGTVNFVGEFFIFFGLFESSIAFSFFFTFGLFLSLVYSLFFYNRVFFGPFFNKLCYYSDCKRLEFYVLFVLFFFVIFFGLFPGIILSFLLVPLKKLVFYASFI